MLLIYGSEIAGAVGMNKYQKRWEVLLTLFKRLDNGKCYQNTVERLKKLGYKIVDEEEKIQHVIEDTGIETAVESLLTSDVHDSDNLNQKIVDFQSQLIDKENELKEKRRQLKEDLSLQTMNLSQIDTEMEMVENQKLKLERECDELERTWGR